MKYFNKYKMKIIYILVYLCFFIKLLLNKYAFKKIYISRFKKILNIQNLLVILILSKLFIKKSFIDK